MKKDNSPVYQHIIPQCYMKNFGWEVKPKSHLTHWLYWPEDVTSPPGKITKMNVQSFGGENHYYTLNINNSRSLIVEDLFGLIEEKYTPIYKKLIDPSTCTLTRDEKINLLKFVVSLALRVKTYHNMMNKLFDQVFDMAYSHFENTGSERYIYFGDNEIDKINLEGKTLEEAKKESKESNRRLTITNIWLHLPKLVSILKEYEIIIWKNNHKLGYISNDNPVTYSGTALYDPNNNWSIPLDNRHKLCLNPPASKSNSLEIFRGNITIPPILDNINALEKRISFVFGNENDIKNSIELKNECDKNPREYINDILSKYIK